MKGEHYTTTCHICGKTLTGTTLEFTCCAGPVTAERPCVVKIPAGEKK